MLFGICGDVPQTTINVPILLDYVSTDASVGLMTYTNAWTTPVHFIPWASFTAGNWYKLRILFNFATDTFDIHCFNSSGTEITASNNIGVTVNVGTVRGTSKYLAVQGFDTTGTTGSLWLDDINDAGL